MSLSQSLYLGLLGLVGVERLVELVLSRRNARTALAQGAKEYGAAHFPVMAAMHFLFLVSCAVEVMALHRAFAPALGVPALLAELLGQGLRYWAIATLGSRWNVRIFVIPGSAPVTSGPYRFVRHPNYVAVVIDILALPLIHGAWMTALVFTLANAAMLYVRIRAEERALGDIYAASFADKPRFMPVGS